METDKKIASASLPPAPPSAPPPSNGSNNSFPRVRPMHGRTTGPTRRSTKGQWTPEEDEILCKAVQHHKGKNWKKIAECFKDRTDVQCLHRWQKVLNPELIKGPWSKEEDEIIVQLVDKYGPKKWSTIAQHLPGRIGKQCRERWHNHLNPAINKEAWTQEEELILIRAHQVHGNRWAELTKYLPGRTDNSIKNHWNSSVKKKLDSYTASGLLAQFQGLPVVSHQNQSIPGASLRLHHSSGDGSVCRGGADAAEANSDCSQVGCSQTASDMANTACQTREELLLSLESDHGKVQITSTTGSYSEQYYTSLDDITFTIPDIPCDFSCSPEYLDENISKDPGTYANKDSNFGAIDLLNISSELAANLSNLSGSYFSADTNHDRVHDPNYQFETGYGESALVNNMAMKLESSGKKVKTEECCSRVIFPEEGGVGHPSSANLTKCSDIIDMYRFRDSLGFQSSFQVSEAGGIVALQPYNPLNDIMGEASQCQNLSSIPSEVSEANGSKTLCYEPPLFPSLDIPFLSCDLAQSCNGVHQEFSPLGIRQLMMSSMSNLTPFKLWDSPSSDDSPDAVLKSAARTFVCTPSILKKRHRDLLSPLSPFSERRRDKKTGSDVENQGFLCTSRLTKEFSLLDVMLNEADDSKELLSPSHDQNNTEVSIEDKENICPVSQKQTEEAHNNHDSGDRTSEEANKNNIKEREGILDHDSTISVYEDCASETSRGILVVCHLNDTQFSSPDGARPKVELKSSYGASEIHQCSKNASKKFATSESGIDKAGRVVSPNFLGQKKETNDSVVSSSQTTCAVSSVMVDSLVNEVGAENLNIFGGTPFRRSIESPSAWKSPWYFSSLVPCPRFDADIMIEDIGFFMSPGERSIDALGLMKQINEQSADAYAEAREVLGNDTPESILRQRCLRNQDPEGETKNVGDSQHEGRLRLASNVSTERRVLDFSECGSPEKSTEKKKCISATSLTSPSCLLKSCR